MNKIQRETNEYIVYSPDSLNYITDKMYDILDKSIKFYKEFFNIKEFRKIKINYFDNIDDFRNFIYDLRGEKESLPSYATGTFDKGMINVFMQTNLLIDSPMYNKNLYVASHELFHIMYQELIWQKEKMPRFTWIDEGMAQFFSGECACELSDKNFNDWFKTTIELTKEIPNLNNMNHKNGFVTEKYNGYKLSLIAVKFLYETMTLEEFKKLLHNKDKIIEYGNTILNNAIDYYNKGDK